MNHQPKPKRTAVSKKTRRMIKVDEHQEDPSTNLCLLVSHGHDITVPRVMDVLHARSDDETGVTH